MPPRHDPHLARLRKRRPAVVVFRRHLRQRRRHVQFRDGPSRRSNRLRMPRRALSHVCEQILFERQDLVFRVQHLALVILQLRRGEPLRIRQRLLALVIRRRQVLVGARDLDVISENVVEAHLERPDARSLPFPLFDSRNVLAAVPAHVAQLVQLRVVALANRPAVRERQRRLVRDGFQNQVGHLRKLVEPVMQTAQFVNRHQPLQRRDSFERPPQRQHVARRRRPQRHLRQQTLNVQHSLQRLAKLRAQNRSIQQLAHRVQTPLNLRQIHRWPQQPLPQQPPAHPRLRLVQRAQHRRLRPLPGIGREQRLDKLQVAHRHRIQQHGIGAVVKRRPVQVIERRPLRLPQVVQNRTRRAHRRRAVRQAAPIERQQFEMFPQRAVRVVRREDPFLDFRPHVPRRPLPRRRRRQIRGKQRLARAKLFERPRHLLRVHLRHAEFARRNVHVRHRRPRSHPRHRRQIVVLARPHQVRVHRRSRRHNARQLALHQRLRQLGVFHLVADGHAVPLLDQPRNVALRRVVRHAAHGDGRALFLVARRERDLKLPRGRHRVIVEQLVEIAQPEHQQRVRRLLLDAVVLPHQRRGGVRRKSLSA